jgi:hypothetical protein
MHEVLPGRRPLVRCFSRHGCRLPGFEPSTLVECIFGSASSRCRLGCLPMNRAMAWAAAAVTLRTPRSEMWWATTRKVLLAAGEGALRHQDRPADEKNLEPSSCQIRAITARQLVG